MRPEEPGKGLVEILLDLPGLEGPAREALERDLRAAVDRHLPGRRTRLLSGRDAWGRRWLRLVVELE